MPQAGRFATEDGALTCAVCSVGKYQTERKKTSCVGCAAGKRGAAAVSVALTAHCELCETGRSQPKEAEESFEQTKRMVAEAVALSVPDFKGATDGTNPILYFGDKWAYGVGGGIFQRPAQDEDVPDRLRGQLRPLGFWRLWTKICVSICELAIFIIRVIFYIKS